MSELVYMRVNDFCQAFGVGRTWTYEQIDAGKLASVKIGKKRLISVESARSLFDSFSTHVTSLTLVRTHADSADNGVPKRTKANKHNENRQ